MLRRDLDIAPEDPVEKRCPRVTCGKIRFQLSASFRFASGIVDIWSPGIAAPVRVEFFGDTVDSMREFYPETQLSTGQLREVDIPPMHELSVTARDFRMWADAAAERWSDERYARSLRDRTAFAEEGEAFAGWEWLIPIIKDCNSNIFEHFKDAVLIVDEPGSIEAYLSDDYDELARRYSEIDQADDIALPPDELYLSVEELRNLIASRQRVELRTLGRAAAEIDHEISLDAEAPKVQIGRGRNTRRPLFLFPIADNAFELDWPAQSAMRYHGRIVDLVADVKTASEEDETVLFVMPSLGVAERITEILSEYQVEARLSLITETGDPQATSIVVTVGRVTGGFELPRSRLIVHVESDVFDEVIETVERRGTAPIIRGLVKVVAAVKGCCLSMRFSGFAARRFVVHIDHGVARFGGLQNLISGRPPASSCCLLR